MIISHTELKPGDACPIAYCTGKLYKLKPSAILWEMVFLNFIG